MTGKTKSKASKGAPGTSAEGRDATSERSPDANASTAKSNLWLWGLVGVVLVVLVVAAKRCGSDEHASAAGAPTVVVTMSPGSSSSQPASRGVAPVVANQEASSPTYRMKFSLGAPAPVAAPTGSSAAGEPSAPPP